MVNQELVSFVKKSLAQGNSRADIEQALLKKGWTRAQVSEVFATVSGGERAVQKPASSFLKSRTFLWIVFALALVSLVVVGIFLFFPSEEEIECTRDRDCDSGFTCDDFQCIEEEVTITLAVEGEACDSTSDCEGDLVCEDDVCVEEEIVSGIECLTDDDCDSGFVCEDDACVEEEETGPSITIIECTDNANCSAGYQCVSDSCEAVYNLTVNCSESDSDYNLTGVGSAYGVWYSNGSVVNQTDTCDESNSSQIMEYWCPGTDEDYENYVYNATIACPSGFSCSSGACANLTVSNVTVECAADADCGTGYVCTSGVCEVEPVVVSACASDCSPYACDESAGTCYTSCDYAGDWSECADTVEGYGCASDDTCVGGYDITTGCIEDDSGYDLTTVGTTTGTSYYGGDEVTWTDFCNSDGQLVEYWCPSTEEAFDGYAYGKTVDCDAGEVCTDGACVAEEVVIEEATLSITSVTFAGVADDLSTLVFDIVIENTAAVEGDATVDCALELSDSFIGAPTVRASLVSSASGTIDAAALETISCIFDITDVKADLIAAGKSALLGSMTATFDEQSESVVVVLEQGDLFECLEDSDCDAGYQCDLDQLGVCEATECNDGLDNDGNGDIDLEDSGCDDVDDTNEYTPVCKDGKDNDGDGTIDYSGAMELTATATEGEAFEGIFSCDWDYAALVDEYFTSEKINEVHTAISEYADKAGMSTSEKVAFLSLEKGRIRALYSPTISTCKEVCSNLSYGVDRMNSDFSIDTFTLDCDFVNADSSCNSPTSTSERFITAPVGSRFAPEITNFFQKLWDFLTKAPSALDTLLGK